MTLLKLIVSIALIALTIHLSNWHATVARLTLISPLNLFGLALAMLALAPVQAVRWQCVLRAFHARLAFREAAITVIISYFFNQVLPSSIGGDVIRVWRVRQNGATLATAVSSVIVDRMVAVIGLVGLVSVLLPWIYQMMPSDHARLQLVIAMSVAVAATGSVFLLQFMPERWSKHRWGEPVVHMSAGLNRLAREPGFGGAALACAVFSHIALGALCFWIAQALSIRVGFFDCILLVPPVMLISMIPASIGGWGLREGAMVVALGIAGVAAADALSISLMFGIVLLISAIPGAILWLVAARPPVQQNLIELGRI